MNQSMVTYNFLIKNKRVIFCLCGDMDNTESCYVEKSRLFCQTEQEEFF